MGGIEGSSAYFFKFEIFLKNILSLTFSPTSFLYALEIIVSPSDYGVTVSRILYYVYVLRQRICQLIFPAERYGVFEPQGVSVVATLARAKIHNI